MSWSELRDLPLVRLVGMDLKDFASKVKTAAVGITGEGRFGRFKVFTCAIKDTWGFRGMSEGDFATALVEAHRAGYLRLCRADLIPAMDPGMVKRSEIAYLNARFHFVDVEGVS